jgi:hypothetical protein
VAVIEATDTLACEFGDCVQLKDGAWLCMLLPDCGCIGDVMRKAYVSVLETLSVDGIERWNKLMAELGFDADPRLFYALTSLLDDRDLIEHGSSIRCSWLTERGKEALALMKEHWK